MQIKCKHCDAEIPAGNLDIKKTLAKCEVCGAEFDFSTQVGDQASGKRYFSEPPEGIELKASSEDLVMEHRWVKISPWFPILFCIALDAYMLVGFVKVLFQGDFIMAAFDFVQLLVCLGVSYVLAGFFLNKTLIYISPQRIKIQHVPVPWLGNKEVLPHEIDQLFVKKQVRNTQNGMIVRFQLCYLDTRGREAQLLSRLRDHDHALYLEQEIESLLGIQDRKASRESV